MADRTVRVRLVADTSQWSTGLSKASKDVTGLETATRRGEKAARSHGASLAALGVSGVALGVAVAAPVKAFMDFDKSMSGVAAVAGATAGQLDQLRAAAIDAGAKTSYSATQAADAEAELAKAGISTSDILGGALTGSLSLAAAGQLGLANAATISGQAMNIFRLRGADVSHIADVLAAAANKSAADVSQLGQALAQGGLLAAQTGLTLEDTTAVLAMFADNALQGSDAGTSLKTMLQNLNPQSNEAAQLMEQLGFRAYDATGKFVGMDELARRMARSFGGLSTEQRNAALSTIFGSDAIRAANIVIGQGQKGFRDYRAAVDDTGAAARMAAIQTDNLAGDVERLGGSLQTALIQTGSTANGVLRSMTQAATHMVDVYSGLPAPLQKGATALGAMTVAATALVVLAPRIQATKVALQEMGAASSGAAGALGRLGVAAGVVGGALTAASLGGDAFRRWVGDVSRTGHAAVTALQDIAAAGTVSTDAMAALGAQSYDFSQALNGVFNRSTLGNIAGFGRTVGSLGGLFPWGDDEVDAARRMFATVDAGLTALVSSGKAGQAAQVFKVIADQARAQGVTVDQLKTQLPGYATALDALATQSDAAAKSQGALGTAAGAAKGPIADVTGEAQRQADEIKRLVGEYDILTGRYSVLGANVDVRNAIADMTDKVTEQRKEVGRAATSLSLQTQAGRDNISMLLGLAQKLDTEAQAEVKLAGSTARGNQILAAQRRRFVEAATAAGFSRQKVTELADTIFKLPPAKATRISAPGARQARAAVDDLRAATHLLPGDVRVRTSAPGARKTAGDIRFIDAAIDALNNKSVSVVVSARAQGIDLTRYPRGGGPSSVGRFASGGVREAHDAQVAAAGAWRVWAEPETGGEAYIPLAPAKRARSEAILEDVAQHFGYALLRYADGGVTVRGDTSAPGARAAGTEIGVLGRQVTAGTTALIADVRAAVRAAMAPPGYAGMGWARQWATVHGAFPAAHLLSSYRPGAVTSSGNRSYHALGRAIDVTPSMAVFDWLARHYPGSTELIYSPAGGRQLWHGRRHMYTGQVRADHFDHVHWAMGQGGMRAPTYSPGRVHPGGAGTATAALVAALARATVRLDPEDSRLLTAVADRPVVVRVAEMWRALDDHDRRLRAVRT